MKCGLTTLFRVLSSSPQSRDASLQELILSKISRIKSTVYQMLSVWHVSHLIVTSLLTNYYVNHISLSTFIKTLLLKDNINEYYAPRTLYT